MLRISDIHTEYLGKTCKLTDYSVILEKEFELLFGIGNVEVAQRLYDYCMQDRIRLIFVDEKPVKMYGLTFFCLKEIGKDGNGDLHFFTLEQLMICG